MRAQTGFREWLKSILGMSKESLNIRYSRAILDAIKELVDEGKYGSYSDFMNRAAAELLCREMMEERIRQIVRDEIQKQKE